MGWGYRDLFSFLIQKEVLAHVNISLKTHGRRFQIKANPEHTTQTTRQPTLVVIKIVQSLPSLVTIEQGHQSLMVYNNHCPALFTRDKLRSRSMHLTGSTVSRLCLVYCSMALS